MANRRKRLTRQPPKVTRISYRNSKKSIALISMIVYRNANNNSGGIDVPETSTIGISSSSSSTQHGHGQAAPQPHATPLPVNREKYPSYQQKKFKLLETWCSIRDRLLSVRLEELSPMSTTCGLCGDQDDYILKCNTCGPASYFCQQCARSGHQNVVFHDLEIWNGKVFLPYHVETTLHRIDHECDHCYAHNILAFDIKGILRKISVKLCLSEEPAGRLLRFGLWPATPSSPKIAFDLKFMELLSVMQLECQTSTKSFFEAVKNQIDFKIRQLPILSNVCESF
ncbi:uncharacterized protein LOC126817401 [Patella vulgata]|uniref:uncharacterized protein LOC126817401 n=1 Tax=Patella vulgata TaxID=6465 RepID=UPI00217F7271|nr:uncharacterized protein LOC126817401 [Patella vulgata]